MNSQRPVEPGEADHYHELKIKPDATASDIRKAYLNLSRQYHPDKLAPDASDDKFKHVGVVLQKFLLPIFTDENRSKMLTTRSAIL